MWTEEIFSSKWAYEGDRMTQDNLTRETLKEMKKISEKDKKQLDKVQKEWENTDMEKGRKRNEPKKRKV